MNSKIAIDIAFYAPRLRPNLKQILQKKEETLAKSGVSHAQFRRLNLLTAQAEREPRHRYELFFLADQVADHQFLFSKPAVPYDLAKLKQLGIQYIVVTQTNPEVHKDFYEEVRTEGDLVAIFNPYQDDQAKQPIDPLPLTGGPFLWKDLAARRANGQPIKIYRLA